MSGGGGSRGDGTVDEHIKALNEAVETVNGIVYLIGIARNQAELDRVADHARQLANLRRVVSHVRIKSPEDGGKAV